MKIRKTIALAIVLLSAGCSKNENAASEQKESAKLESGRLALAAETEPWNEPQDSAAAINSADAYAWRLFVALNWPADLATKIADKNKKLGEAGPVVWETWANARNAYPRDGSDPGPWLSNAKLLAADASMTRSLQEFDNLPLQQQLRTQGHGGPSVNFDPTAAANQINETRLNRATYEFVRTNSLYNLAGQKTFAASGKVAVQFPVEAKEVKAQWRVIPASEKPRYHWTEVKDANGNTIVYGLTALHITTKDLPNWFWATFEHVDNPTRANNEPWQLPSRDTFACTGKPADCNLAPKGIGLEGTPWENYRLRGTQIDFTTSKGETTLLANSQPEAGFQMTSSCITCHSRATIAVDGSRLCVFKPNNEGYVGTPDPTWFVENGRTKFIQLDFVWSMFRAGPNPTRC